MIDLLEKARRTIADRNLAASDAAVLLMVSGGSDSTALAYLGAALKSLKNILDFAVFWISNFSD